ncbi:MAG: endonuclease/exonuclease/phosphatase family protein [Phycisphaerales bacterium JB039]
MMIRIMTYNIRACLGVDNIRSAGRIADVIGAESVDLVALQEVDHSRPRSDGADQARQIADRLAMRAIFAPSFAPPEGGQYGNAVLATGPLELVHHGDLGNEPGGEPRCAMWTRARTALGPLDLINTHLSFRRRQRPRQIDALLAHPWPLTARQRTRPVVLCGDLNCAPRDPGFRRLAALLRDAPRLAPGRTRATWPTRRPLRRIDHIFVSGDARIVAARVVRSPLARRASDHFPVVVDLDLPVEAPA